MADPARLQTWFEGLSSRTLDLVGDYAGDELFIIEGDSLLLQCFSDKSLDFNNGFQLQHATYLVEKFIAQLYQRKCVFHIVFLSESSSTCIPPNTPPRLWPKYHLAREATIQHLVQNLPATVPSINVRRFDSYKSDDFGRYLGSVGAYFLMCHDGAGTSDASTQKLVNRSHHTSEEPENDAPSSENEHAISGNALLKLESTRHVLRSTIHWFVLHGYNVAILNSLQCRDSKVLCMVLEGSMSRARQLYSPNPSFVTTSGHTTQPTPGEQRLINTIRTITKSEPFGLTQRDWVAILSFGKMFPTSISNSESLLGARAMLLHTAILSECRLSERVVESKHHRVGERILEEFTSKAVSVLTSVLWKDIVKYIPGVCNLSDCVDGRVFLETLRALEQTQNMESWGFKIQRKFDLLVRLVLKLFEVDFRSTRTLDLAGSASNNTGVSNEHLLEYRPKFMVNLKDSPNDKKVVRVLPFNNKIVDTHLKPVSVVTADFSEEAMSTTMSRTFQELTHWHNHKRPLNPMKNTPLTDWQKSIFNRRDQFFMADVQRYAASLTNAVGVSLEPEPVFVKPQPEANYKVSKTITHRPSAHKKNNQDGKLSVREQAADFQRSKQNQAVDSHFASWRRMVIDFEKEVDFSLRYTKVQGYFSALRPEKRSAIQVEVLAYLTYTLILLWKERCNNGHRGTSMHIAALIWKCVQEIAKSKHGLTRQIVECMKTTAEVLILPRLDMQHTESRELSFKFAVLNINIGTAAISLSPTEFQLIHAGPYIDRSMGSAADSRVHDFEPDKWQREVLDEIDARRSLFVVAPTSAGKTFISFYAMKQILEENDDGVLVYVAPTKALVNQIAAEVQARFSKSYKNTAGKSVWAIHTRDYRINNPTGCQILITVPHILQIMLLAPTNAKTWSPRIKRIIFDEVHCIGQAEDGVIWEQLLLLAPCPIIALSATVGHPDEFKDWLEKAQNANGLELRMIQHKTRYSDLRKYVYRPPKDFVFNGLAVPSQLSALGLDGNPHMGFLHPVASLIDRSRGLPDDLTLEPRDCLTLWKAIKKHATVQFPVRDTLDPFTALPSVIKKADVLKWEGELKKVLRDWMSHESSPFEAVVQELTGCLSTTTPDVQKSRGLKTSLELQKVNENSIIDTTLPLLCSLNDQDALPALLFNYDRAKCEEICYDLVAKLKTAEDHWKAMSTAWKNKLAKYEEWQRSRENDATLLKRMEKGKKGKKGRDDDDDDQISSFDLERDMGENSQFESFNPDDPVSCFHFADEKKLTTSEFEEYAKVMRRREVPEGLIAALKRGIGVHHAGMNRRYRQVCEILFRKGYLRVVIATGTLALGINMPCKTVVFSGDSVYLTALNFRQAAGRAGRRGFDFLGNVVFQGLPYQKVCRLLSSRLPDLNGHFPITTSLVLRLMTLLHESEQSPYAVKAINAILSCARIYLGGPESKATVLHHLRFSIEYLRRNWLLDGNGVPLNFAGMVSHLYYTENSSFAFHALLSEGYFHKLCESIHEKPEETLRTLMLVLSHIFGRQFLRPSVLECLETKKSTSVVVLPALPPNATQILESHNKKTLGIYSGYVDTFIEKHIDDDDCTLPLTMVKCGGDKPSKDICTSMNFLPPTRVNSAFVALSGHRDEWKNISQLCQMVRSGVWLEESVIPHVEVSPENGHTPLNAYLYDFFRHGNVHALVTENMIRKGDLWFILNDFSLVLATIVTSLENFMKLSPGTDCEMLEAMGAGDAYEDEIDDDAQGASEVPTESSPLSPAKNKQSSVILPERPVKAKRKPVADSWEDEMSDETPSDWEAEDTSPDSQGTSPRQTGSTGSLTQTSADAVLDGKGLLQVLQTFKMLQTEFNAKFKAIWA
ncbi:putative DEAD/DEAH box helicase [Aspergillus stella-maris]|uniref:putative DEAD/DEAH box helicase n=1 Tax=Aspergillus stella-maris TaxID=1810926 RepID=UPI003CCCF0FC